MRGLTLAANIPLKDIIGEIESFLINQKNVKVYYAYINFLAQSKDRIQFDHWLESEKNELFIAGLLIYFINNEPLPILKKSKNFLTDKRIISLLKLFNNKIAPEDDIDHNFLIDAIGLNKDKKFIPILIKYINTKELELKANAY